MATPKKAPQDRQPKAATLPPPPADRIRTITWEGYEYSFDPRRMDDLEFMEIMGELEDKPYLIAKVIQYMLGAEQYAEFKANHSAKVTLNDDGTETREETPITSTRLQDFMTKLDAAVSALGN